MSEISRSAKMTLKDPIKMAYFSIFVSGFSKILLTAICKTTQVSLKQ